MSKKQNKITPKYRYVGKTKVFTIEKNDLFVFYKMGDRPIYTRVC